ncbi:MaoC/PaaZ C-terminal domain-containing protein [Rhodoferax sp.]|uniref:MaoC family dehydratase n=1 Tax=Rhodoferax sp. TaxID=50421 RepID=UPI002606B637|nr:MaoC/PaaZ C-terminal domain-containing protein [Rhodoferax sp.]MDD3937196.1 MaoC/PaaZ C-terminal domain-containing protein [Rhodoferax sp.]
MLPGNFFDDIRIGDERLTPRVTVTEGHILTYAGVAGDFSPVHMDDVYAKTTYFGGRIAHGLMGLSLTDGLKVQSAFFKDGVALGWTWNFKGAIRIGDTLQVRFCITDARHSRSRPEMGILVIAIQLINQRDEVVQEGEHRLMVPRDPELMVMEKMA